MLSIMPPPKFKAFDSNGKPLAGGKVYTYIPGTSTPKATYADPNGISANPNPVVLDSKGEATIWLQGFYKIVLTDANNVQQWSVDQISSSPSVATPNAEWLAVNASFTFVSATQFSVAGDMTGTFQQGRRVQTSVSAGTVYGTVTASIYSGGVTAVTIACDSGSLDAGLTAINVGLLAVTNPSIPIPANSPASAMPWADARAYANLAAAISAIGSAPKVILISNQQNVSSSLTVPSNVTLRFQQGGSLNISAGAALTINGNIEAGLFQIFTLNGTAAITLGPVKEVYPQWFGAKGDGTTDDTAAIQNAVNAATTQYSATQMNFYTEQTQLPLRFAKGTYIISSAIDLSFRNDIRVGFESGARLRWVGAQDGTMVELKCSSRVKLVDLWLDGNGIAGTFIHHSGNGTSETGATHDALSGKGNVSLNVYENVYCENQYTGSSKAVIDTIPYAADSAYPYYYSMDDSQFYSFKIRTNGTNGFGMALGSGTNTMFSPQFICPNGISMPSGSGPAVVLHAPMFSLLANQYGAIYAANNVHVSSVDIIGGYLEATTKPLFSFAAGATAGSIKKLGIYGGLFSQNSGAAAFISVPSGIPGAIYINGARNQSQAAGLTLKVDAASSYVSIDSGSINELQGNGNYVDAGFAVTNALFTSLDRFHSAAASGQAGFSAPSIAAATAYDMQRFEIVVPPYRKLYLNKANYDLENTALTTDLRLRVNCSQSGAAWTSSAYFGGDMPSSLLYDNSASAAATNALVIVQIYNSNGATAYTPKNHAGWSVVLDNR